MPPTKPSLGAALWGRVDRGAESECWEWQGCRRNGYGRFTHRRQMLSAHRTAYELSHGPIPPGQMVLHRCDNPPCCNPAHLFLGDQTVNMRDMAAKGRGRSMAGVANPRARLTPDQVRAIRRRAVRGRYTELAAEFGVTGALIGMIARRQIWQSVPDDADFVGQFDEGRTA